MTEPTQPTITLTLNVEAINLILAGLGELPAKQSKGLMDHIEFTGKQQLAQQETSDAAKPEKDAVAKDPAPAEPEPEPAPEAKNGKDKK